MKKYYIDYRDKGGELCHVWCEADSPEDAERFVRSEYWDVDEIINISEG
ncbi:MAG: hypothetical protein J6T22_09360 [Bacteroidales bacterium]|nr:hypothetical protein [Bacteroidales bacterium]MBO7617401.1 hypothetical protein [Bacteroidales bacterium]